MEQLTRGIADWVADQRGVTLSDTVMSAARRSLVDTVGIAVRGSQEPAPRIARRVLAAQSSGPSSLIGMGATASPELAALINGISADILGYSETSGVLQHHPSVPALAAALAVGEDQGAPGAAVVTAHIVGVEVASKLAYAVQPELNIQGWHPVSLLGAFGACAAAALLLDLDAEEVANALGLAGMTASGTKAGMGTMGKSYSRGKAAESGVVAAYLARAGFTGPTHFIEAHDGFLALYGGGSTRRDVVDRLGRPFEYESPGLTLKAFPSCTCSHAAIASLLGLRQRQGIDPSDVEQVHFSVTPTVAHYLRFPEPANPFEAKYSLQFCAASALVDGRVGVDSFSQAQLADPEKRRLMAQTSMAVDEEYARLGFNPAGGPYACRVTVTLRDGRVLQAEQRSTPWDPSGPPDSDELWGKFDDCAEGLLGSRARIALRALLEQLETVKDVRPLMRILSGLDAEGGER